MSCDCAFGAWVRRSQWIAPCPLTTCVLTVQVIPHSVGLVTIGEGDGGGNRISEEQIKLYLNSTLGDAPRPEWGVPGGWGAYLSGAVAFVLLGVGRCCAVLPSCFGMLCFA